MVVVPVYRFTPDNVSVPAPAFVKAPVVLAAAPEIVSALVTSIVEVVPVVKVNALFVEAVLPVYSNVPPPKTKFPTALVDCPILLALPPLAILEILSVPLFIVVAPVYVLTPLKMVVPASFCVKPPVLLTIPLMVKVVPVAGATVSVWSSLTGLLKVCVTEGTKI
jgi:hypothetical protein